MLRRYAFTLIAVASMLASSGAQAQTVVSRARLGNDIEDITFVPNGRLANNLAFLNGNSLYVAPLPKGGAPTKLFDMRDIPDAVFANGLTYIPSQRLFAFHHSSSATLYLVDENGVFQGTRPMVFPGAEATYLEAIDYLPPSSASYPDHLVAIVNTFTDPNLTPRIEVVGLDGTVEHEIVVQPFGSHPDGSFDFDPSYGLGALAFKAPNRLLVTVFDGTNNIWALDFTGNVVGGGPVYSDSDYCEGIVQVPDGRIVVSHYYTGKMLFFDQNMNRRPAYDRTYSVGVGVGLPTGIAWDSDTGAHLVLSLSDDPRIFAVSQSLDSAVSAVLHPTPAQVPRRLAYISNDHLVATWVRRRVSNAAHNFITLYDPSTGAFHSEVDVTATLGGTGPLALEYIPSTDQFAVIMGGEPNTVKIASRTGALVRSIDISAAGLFNPASLAFFDPSDPSGGRMLVGDRTQAAVVDFNGNVLPGGFNIRDGLNLLAPADLSAITTGPQAGGFAILDGWTNELVVFKLCALCGYLRGTGPDANPPTLFLGSSPSASTPKYRDSAGVNFAGGNAYKEIGTWTATLPAGTSFSAAGLDSWAGLKNSDDTGARFDLRVELYKNGALFASGLKRCVTGLTRNANDAAELAVSTGSFAATAFNGSDVLGLKVLTRIGTNADDTRCSGPGAKNSAVGLRLYFDSMSRPSLIQVTP